MRGLLSIVAACAVALFSARAEACDAAFGMCGVQQQAFAQAYAAPVLAAPVYQAPVYAAPIFQQQVVQSYAVPVQRQIVVQRQAHAHAPVFNARFAPQPRGRLFGGRSVARSRSIVRGGASAQAQAGTF